MIDTHTHLTWDCFKLDLKEVLERAYQAGVKTVINVGPDLKRSQLVVNLDCSPLKSYAAIGFHPHEASSLAQIPNIDVSIQQNMKKLKQIYQKHVNKIVAIGECGLDYHFQGPDYPFANIPEDKLKITQMQLFRFQINLAKQLNLPLVIHCRPSTNSRLQDAWNDIFVQELKGHQGVFHSFTGNYDQAKKALTLGFYLGFSCVVTYPKNDYLRQIIKKIPLDKILTETDCPFLPPQSKRGQRSEPADVAEVIKLIAHVKNLTHEKVAQTTYQNACKLFKLVSPPVFGV